MHLRKKARSSILKSFVLLKAITVESKKKKMNEENKETIILFLLPLIDLQVFSYRSQIARVRNDLEKTRL